MTGGDCSITGEDPDDGVTTVCNTTVASETFTYDEVGNRTDLGAVIAAGNRLTSFDGWTISYDADGNMIQQYKPGVYNRQYYWSAEGQLDSLRQDDWFRVHYDYDAFGRVVRRSIGDLNGMSVEEHYLWDGANLVAILDSSFNRISEYVHEPGTIDRPFALVLGSTSPTNVRFIQQDELGNALGNFESATVTQTVSYGTWGSPTVTIDGRNRLLWKGLLWQGDFVRLHYMRNRWYDPEFGRFISEDPIGIAGGINQYAFAGSDPVNGFDPSGLCQRRCPVELPEVVIQAPRSYPWWFHPEHGVSEHFFPVWWSVVDAMNDGGVARGEGGGGSGRTIGPATARARQPRRTRRDVPCFAAVTQLAGALALDLGYAAGAALAVQAGAPVLATLGTLAVADALGVTGVSGASRLIMRSTLHSAGAIGLNLMYAGAYGERATISGVVTSVLPVVRTARGISAVRRQC